MSSAQPLSELKSHQVFDMVLAGGTPGPIVGSQGTMGDTAGSTSTVAERTWTFNAGATDPVGLVNALRASGVELDSLRCTEEFWASGVTVSNGELGSISATRSGATIKVDLGVTPQADEVSTVTSAPAEDRLVVGDCPSAVISAAWPA